MIGSEVVIEVIKDKAEPKSLALLPDHGIIKASCQLFPAQTSHDEKVRAV